MLTNVWAHPLPMPSPALEEVGGRKIHGRSVKIKPKPRTLCSAVIPHRRSNILTCTPDAWALDLRIGRYLPTVNPRLKPDLERDTSCMHAYVGGGKEKPKVEELPV